MASNISDVCTMCVRQGTLTCDGCHTTKYCTTECQNLEKDVHRFFCKRYKDFVTPPEEGMRRALYFPAGDKAPRFIWFPTNANPEMEMFEKFLGVEAPVKLLREFYSINRNLLQNRQLEKSITLFHPSLVRLNPATQDMEIKEGEANSSFASLGRDNYIPDWRGPVFAYCLKPPDVSGPEVVDNIELADIRHIADWVSSTGALPTFSKSGKIKNRGLCHKGLVLAVKINCSADMKQTGPHIESVIIPIDDPIFRQQASGICNMIGLPIQFRKASEVPLTPLDDDLKNDRAAYLATDVSSTTVFDPKANVRERNIGLEWNRKDIIHGVQGFGSPPASWGGNVGSVIAVRTDGKILHPEHMHTICTFCQSHMRPKFDKFYQEATHPTGQDLAALRESILGEMTKAKFVEFYEASVAARKKVLPNEPWHLLPSPYEIDG